MPSGFQVTCANKNPQGVIVRLGGPGWSLSCHEAVQKINAQLLRLHIFIGDEAFDIGIRGSGNDAYLVLEPDAKPLSEVEALRSC
ncbi:MAG: hypothetical protein HC915_09890 [Anaerolineae bacterium]|nr:hypothetical protein [Anaerolineae bacterium]